nr:flagellar hook protein FlgE [Aureimonas sp. SA4125]
MRTSVSGMNAQATRLSAVAENIANSDTTGYKQSQTEFSSLILPSNAAGYNSGAVEANVRQLISQQGGLSFTGNDNSAKKIDLAVDGQGFLAVGDGNGGAFLTRAGSFTQQADGSLVNAAGYTLMGYPVTATGTDAVLNGFAGLEEVNLKTSLLSANPTTKGVLTVPLDKSKLQSVATSSQTTNLNALAAGEALTLSVTVDAAAYPVTITAPAGGMTNQEVVDAINTQVRAGQVAGGLPATLPDVASLVGGKLVLTSNTTNAGTASQVALTVTAQPAGYGLVDFTAVSGHALPSQNTTLPDDAYSTAISVTVYNNSGEAVKLDIYYTKKDDETWEMSVFDSRLATTGTADSPFPYGAAGSAPLSTATLNFDPTTFTLSSITGGTNSTGGTTGLVNIDLSSIGGSTNFALDLGDTTQYTGNTQPLAAAVDGNPAEVISKIKIGADGTITATFASGTARDLFKIPLALVNSPDSMTALAGNVYSAGVESGTVLMGFGGSAGFGNLTAGALEESTVDLANELTTMIAAQRSYTANSKVFQTGSEIMDVLVNLKR